MYDCDMLKVMKKTFYGQFVAGEDTVRIQPTIHRYSNVSTKFHLGLIESSAGEVFIFWVRRGGSEERRT